MVAQIVSPAFRNETWIFISPCLDFHFKSKYSQSFGGDGTWGDAYSYNNVENGVNFLPNFKSALGACSSSSTTDFVNAVSNSAEVDPTIYYYNRNSVSVRNNSNYVIIAIGLRSGKNMTAFETTSRGIGH
ncbi:hypothetical protein BC936DRAFT_142879 [Jimgerdemannia flammicorona]|uniref:Uncharacterized protein n=1 Tax=Jimgerdemannia flammicorona TaxID=994334 RepID=A0A433DEQ4_9FUNG|nr:hypothetical protein BC936DRAFT_142879 [Jimgerdemannia flammicorona]